MASLFEKLIHVENTTNTCIMRSTDGVGEKQGRFYHQAPVNWIKSYTNNADDFGLQVTKNTQKLNGPRLEKTCLRGFANNTGTDQPAHPRSLISAFVICFLESTICTLATGEISIC